MWLQSTLLYFFCRQETNIRLIRERAVTADSKVSIVDRQSIFWIRFFSFHLNSMFTFFLFFTLVPFRCSQKKCDDGRSFFSFSYVSLISFNSIVSSSSFFKYNIMNEEQLSCFKHWVYEHYWRQLPKPWSPRLPSWRTHLTFYISRNCYLTNLNFTVLLNTSRFAFHGYFEFWFSIQMIIPKRYFITITI